MKKIVISVMVGVLSSIIFWGIQSVIGSPSKELSVSYNYKSVTLTISATNSDIEIHKSDSGIPYQGGVISSADSDSIVHLPKGQPLTVNMFGTNSDLKISKSIADQVSVNNTGTNSDVTLF